MKTSTRPTLLPDPAQLDPPRGYRPLAWFGLFVNLLTIPLVLTAIFADPTWRVTNIVVGASAVLPAVCVGLVATIALLRWRHWGQILAIVALSLSLAISLPYGIVRLVLVDEGRLQLAVLAPLLWIVNAVVLVYWCRPVIRQYLR
ncbi:MAG: Hepatitis C virus core protein [Cyanobium sp.]